MSEWNRDRSHRRGLRLQLLLVATLGVSAATVAGVQESGA